MSRIKTVPLLLAICVTAGLLTFCSCTDEPTAPLPPITSHEFTWEVDTLPAFFTAKAMYGTSASNVYVVGYTTAGPEYGIRRWDGYEWTNLRAGKSGGNLADVDGMDSTFVVFLSVDPGAAPPFTGIHSYDNGNYYALPLPLGTRRRSCIHVVSRNEIYLGGVDGIQRYDGTKWEWMLDSTETVVNEFVPKYIYKFDDGSLEFVSQRNVQGSDGFSRWIWGDNIFINVDSFNYPEEDNNKIRFGHYIQSDKTDVFSTGTGGTYKRTNGKWVKLHAEKGAYISGPEHNLFIVQGWTNFWHYNGSTMKNLWSQLLNLVPDINIIHAVYYIDGVLFISAELEGTRNAVMIRGRHRGG